MVVHGEGSTRTLIPSLHNDPSISDDEDKYDDNHVTHPHHGENIPVFKPKHNGDAIVSNNENNNFVWGVSGQSDKMKADREIKKLIFESQLTIGTRLAVDHSLSWEQAVDR